MRKYHTYTFMLMAVAAFFMAAFKMDITPKALDEGNIAPDFEGIDQFGKNYHLQDELAKGPVVLIFYRGSWCKYCNKHLGKLEDSIQYIVEKGATVIAVTPEKPEYIKETSDKYGQSFRIIQDPDLSIMNAYGVRFTMEDKKVKKYKTWGIDLPKQNGDNAGNLPIPATYVIDKNGKIKWVHFDENYKVRASIAEVVENL